MESLPLEIVEHIAQYLTPQELAACCAVSVEWRSTFNQDIVWKPHCNKVIAENLETAQCRVEPGFVSPESEDSTLSPVGHWRLCYMRQKHLENNWRKFKHVRDEIRGNEFLPLNEDLPCILVSNDFVIIPNIQRIELWDLRNAPVYLESLFCDLFDTDYYVVFVIDEDTIVILNKCVQVYTFNSKHSTWQFKYFFFYNEEIVITSHMVNSVVSFPVYKFNRFTYNIGHYLIYSLIQENQYFRIWDIQKGKFLKKERFPEYVNSNKGCINVLVYLYTQKTKPIDIAVLTVIYEITFGSCVVFFYAYSLKQCKFQPFKIRHECDFNPKKCVLVDNIFAVHYDTSVYIYNVVTTHLLLKVNTIPSEISTKLGKIIIINEVENYVFDLQTLKLRCIKERDEMQCMGWLSSTSFGYPLVEKLYYTVQDADNSFNVWEAGNSKTKDIISIGSYRDLRSLYVNECKTKVILKFNKIENNGFTVLTFW